MLLMLIKKYITLQHEKNASYQMDSDKHTLLKNLSIDLGGKVMMHNDL